CLVLLALYTHPLYTRGTSNLISVLLNTLCKGCFFICNLRMTLDDQEPGNPPSHHPLHRHMPRIKYLPKSTLLFHPFFLALLSLIYCASRTFVGRNSHGSIIFERGNNICSCPRRQD